MMYLVIETLKRGARGNYAPRTVYKGEIISRFYGHTYGCIGPEGIALTDGDEITGVFFEYPRSALEEYHGD
jgi:hypothetical protein